MFFLRAGYWSARLLRQSALWLIVLTLSSSLFFMGGLIWFGNTWAFIPDNNPDTFLDTSIIIGGLDGKGGLSTFGSAGDGRIPLTGGKLVKGNGDQDDNKQEPLVIVFRLGALVEPNFSYTLVFFREDMTVKSYLDFGHLKIFPEASVSYTSEKSNPYGNKAAALYLRGGLFYC